MGRVDEAAITARFVAWERVLDEQLRRLVAAAEAQAAGSRGISVVARATGVSRRAIRTGKSELEQLHHSSEASGSSKGARRIRKLGGGRTGVDPVSWTPEDLGGIHDAKNTQTVSRRV